MCAHSKLNVRGIVLAGFTTPNWDATARVKCLADTSEAHSIMPEPSQSSQALRAMRVRTVVVRGAAGMSFHFASRDECVWMASIKQSSVELHTTSAPGAPRYNYWDANHIR
jgi:hypothetical protein